MALVSKNIGALAFAAQRRPQPPVRGDDAKKPSAFTLKQRVTSAEEAMGVAQRKLSELETALAAPGLFERDPKKGAALSKQRADAERALELAEEAWLAATGADGKALIDAYRK